MKKIRGQSRRLERLMRNIGGISPFKTTDCECEHFHVPSGQWLDSSKTYGRIKTEFMRKWLEKTAQICAAKPENLPFCKAVTIVPENELSASQIVIFYDEDYYSRFFSRNDGCQRWELNENAASLLSLRNINCPLNEKCYTEILNDDGMIFMDRLYVFGDI